MLILEEFEKQLMKDLSDDNIDGSISAAIVKQDEIIWAKAFGPSKINRGSQADTKTIYRVGSVAKSFTAFLMMQFVQEGLIELDSPVENHFPNIRELEGYSDATKITFRQLASHTAGLIREPKLEKADVGPIEEWESKVFQSIPRTSLDSQPGEKFSYSNIGYGILGLALSRIAGRSFMKLVEEKILKPLHMENTFFIVPQDKLEDLAQGIGGGPFGEEELDIELPQKEHLGRGYKVPNGGLYSTPTDLAKFVMSNTGWMEILKKNYLDIMHSKQTPEASYHGYGLGYELYQDPRMSITGHSGGVLGYSANYMFEKDCGYGVILMRNYNWGTTSWDIGPRVLLRKLVDFEKANMSRFNKVQ